MSDETVSEVRRRILETQELPPLPQVAAELLLLFQGSSEDDLERLRGIVEQDPGLVARIMGWANSAYYGTRGSVRTLDRAIFGILGLRTVKSLLLSIVLNRTFNTRSCPSFELEDYWHRALLTAHCGRSTGTLLQEGGFAVDPDDAFLGGLLHNLGLLLLVHLYPKPMERVMRKTAHSDDEKLRRKEVEVLGLNHCQAGAWLTHRWHLPDQISGVISGHDDPQIHHTDRLAGLVGHCRRQVDRVVEPKSPTAQSAALRTPRWMGLTQADWRPQVEDLIDHRQRLLEQARNLS